MKSSDQILSRWPFLARAWERGRLAQSLLLVGDVDATHEAAMAVVRQVLCEGSGGQACACRGCSTNVEAHPDVIWLRPEPKTIRLEMTLKALTRAGSAPLWAPALAVVFQPFTLTTPEAENAMLKSLEEPADYAHYVLIAERVDQVLATVRSRCQLVSLEDAPAVHTSFDPKWFSQKDRDFAADLVAAGRAVRSMYTSQPEPRLFSLFSVLLESHQSLQHNSNLDIARERTRLAWEDAFGRT